MGSPVAVIDHTSYADWICVTGRMGTGRAVRNREYQLDETRLGKEQIVNLSITYCKTIVN
jgi:hypothetical protein